MILRMWKAWTTPVKVDDYVRHVTTRVFPAVGGIEGHRGAYLLRRNVGKEVGGEKIEIVVLTLWESIDAIRKFAGPDADKAVVEPEAQAVLTSFDERATHFDVLHAPEQRADAG